MPRRLVVMLFALAAVLAMLAAPPAARADGIIIVDPPGCDPACPEPVAIGDFLEVRNHDVEVRIDSGVAETRIDQTFVNPNSWAAEGTYLFPVPRGAAVGEFRMWVDGEPIEAKILDAEQARSTYEEIVRNLRDPALLEYAGQGLVQASVFPIPPGGERRIEISYAEVLPNEGGLSHYRYGLDVERFSAAPLERASISVEIASDEPLRAIYSPSHSVAVDRIDETTAKVGWEASDVRPDTDFDLYFSTSADAVSAHLVSEYDPAAKEGHFLLLASPGIDATAETVAKDVILVLDTSGSMDGEKIEQARTALVSVLERLNPEDRFAVVEFSTGVRAYERELLPASERAPAIDWVNRLPATGGTDIDQALSRAFALAEDERPTMVMFLTDGVPTEGQTDITQILSAARENAPANVRLFAFGVGDDVDTLLLDSLSQEIRGRTIYVRPGEDLDSAVASFYGGISAPVLADLGIDWGDLEVVDLSPDPLPDLFNGSQLVVAGRYEAPGAGTITLTGTVNGEERAFAFADQELTADRGEGWIGRLWATRRVGYLLNQIRLNGENPELVDAIVDLSIRYGIVTPYTSYLLTEDDILSAEGRERAMEAAMQQAAAPQASTGAQAVTTAQDISGMGGATSASMPTAIAVPRGGATPDEVVFVDARQQVREAGDRTYFLRDAVWTDSTFDPEADTATQVEFLSDEYFALLASDPALSDAFALGERVIVESGGAFYEIVPAA